MAKPLPPKTDVDINDNGWVRFFSALGDRSFEFVTLTQSLTPLLVAANTTAEQTHTVESIQLDDKLLAVDYVTHDGGIIVYRPRAFAVNTIKLLFGNITGGGITPTVQTYTFYLIRF